MESNDGGGTPVTGDVQQVLKPEPNRGGGRKAAVTCMKS